MQELNGENGNSVQHSQSSPNLKFKKLQVQGSQRSHLHKEKGFLGQYLSSTYVWGAGSLDFLNGSFKQSCSHPPSKMLRQKSLEKMLSYSLYYKISQP